MIVPIITGYTASGKTTLALTIAQHLDVEIISADAFQVYRYMDIGTAKPDKEQLSSVKHHLIDIKNPDENYSAGDFFELAESKIDEIIKRGKIPLIVGGTGLYVETLTKGIFAGPPRNDGFRDYLKNEIISKGVDYFYTLLHQKDPSYAEKISKGDINKIVRAFEIMEFTGMTVTEAHIKLHRNPKYKYLVYIIDTNRVKLYQNINERVIKMFDDGWVYEVKNLLNRGYNEHLSSFKAIGYREIAKFLKEPTDIDDLIADIQTKTRQFAKRQITWFRHMNDLNLITLEDLDIKNFSYQLLRKINPEDL